MTNPLTSVQLATLQNILNDNTQTTDQRVALYYQTLASYGYAYGTLAYEVASNTGLDGLVANDFLQNYATKYGVTYNPNVASTIRYQLAQDDIAARKAVSGNDIPGKTIERYHAAAFSPEGLAIAAWTAEVPYQLLGESGWNSILSGFAGQSEVGVEIAGIIAKDSLSLNNPGKSAEKITAIGWLHDTAVALSQAVVQLAGQSAAQQAQTLINSTNSFLAKYGYYAVMPGDTADSIAQFINQNNGLNISAATLQTVNRLVGGSDLTSGNLIFVPTTETTNIAASSSSNGYAYVSIGGQIYSTGAKLDGSDSGMLIASDDGRTFNQAAGSWQTASSSVNSTTGISNTQIALPDDIGGLLGAQINTDPSVVLADGTTINLSSIPVGADITLSAPIAGQTPEQILLNDLSALGDPLSASQLDALDYNYQHPTGAGYTVDTPFASGQIDGGAAYENLYTLPSNANGSLPDATVIGADNSGAQIPTYNVLRANGDLSTDTLVNIQDLDVGSTGTASLTAAQFAALSYVDGYASTINAATGGVYDLSTKPALQFASDNDLSLTATDWSGTTLIGNNGERETLTASLFGNDTLVAGNGSNDTLVAGEGVDTIIGGLVDGGAYGDTFIVENGLTAGSSITAQGNGNLLVAGGDISQATITGIQTLQTSDTLTLNTTELNSFSSITPYEAGDIALNAASGGVYSLQGKTGSSITDLSAMSNDGTTLVADNVAYDQLFASVSGNDTLITGTAGNNKANAQNSSGNDTIFLNGANDTAALDDSLGNDVVSGGDGAGIMVTGQYAAGNNQVTLGNGAGDSIDMRNAYGDNTLRVGNGNKDKIYAGSGNDTVTAGNGTQDTILAGSGNDTLIGGNGGDAFYTGSGVDTVQGGSGNDFIIINDLGSTLAAGDVIDGGGGTNTIIDQNTTYVDLSPETLNNIQVLDAQNVGISLAELQSLSQINVGINGQLTVTTGGTIDLTHVNLLGSNITVTATSNDPTTLIGSNAANETLKLTGSGNDTLIGGTGSDNFYIGTGIDTITGNGAGNTLYASGNLSHDVITGIQTLDDGGQNVTLTAVQDAAFSSIIGGGTVTVLQALATGGDIAVTPDQLAAYYSITGGGTIEAAAGGTYDFSGLLDPNSVFTLTATTNDGTTLIGSDGDNLTLNASASGNDTLQAGNGQNVTLVAGGGVDTLIGGSGSDLFVVNDPVAGTSILGSGSGQNTLEASGDLSQLTLSNIQTLQSDLYGDALSLTAGQFSQFSTLADTAGGWQIDAATGGTYSLAGKTIEEPNGPGGLSLVAESQAGTTLIGDDNGLATLRASATGNDTLIAGAGGNNITDAGSGVDNLIGGAGNDSFKVYNSIAAGSVIDGGGGKNTLKLVDPNADLSQVSVSNIQTLKAITVTLNADQLNGFSNVQFISNSSNSSLTSGVIYAATGGTYSLAGKSADLFDLYALSNNGTTLIGNDVDGQSLVASASGNDMLQAGNGAGDMLVAGAGVDTLMGGNGGDTFIANNDLAAGTVITGGTGANILQLSDPDISKATITGIQTLEVGDSVTLNADQLNEFTTLIATGSNPALMTAATGGTYSLANKSVTGTFDLTAGSNDGTTLIGNANTPQILTASLAGNDTLIGGTGGDNFYAGTGIDTITGHGIGNTLYASGDLTHDVITGIQILNDQGQNVTLTAAQDAEFTSIVGGGIVTVLAPLPPLDTHNSNVTLTVNELATYSMITGGGTITTNGGGTFDLSTKLDPKFNFSLAAGTNDGTTLIGNDQVQQGLSASQYGNDTLIAGNGLYDILTAGQGNDTIIGGNGNDLIGIGSGVDTVKGGTGNDYFIVRGDLAAGTTIDGGGGNDTLITSDGGYNDLSGATITNVQTLRITRAVLTADELNNVSTINTNSDDGDYYGAIYAATGGTYSLAGKNTQNEVDMYATSAAGTTLIGNDSDGETLYGSATGNDTLIAGNGAYDGLQAGGGNDTLKGGTGYDMYEFVTSFGKAIIDNTASGANTTASGEVDFYTGGVPGNGLNASNLWFQRSGNDLLIDELGTTSQIDIAGWYGNNPGAQVQSFHSSDGLVLDTQLAQLVQAMAIYSTNNLGFNAATATAMPNDPTLQGAIAAAWHH